MVGLGRPQTCSGAQSSLHQLAKRRLRDLVEGLWGSSSESSGASHQDLGGGSQQGDGACDPTWMGSLLSHRAVTVTVLVASAALAFLAFWDIWLVFELVRTLHTFLEHPLLHVVATHCTGLPAEMLFSSISYQQQRPHILRGVHHRGLTALACVQILWPWRGCMAIVNWVYHSLDERCMSQRRQNAEVALRAAMKSGEPVLSIIPYSI